MVIIELTFSSMIPTDSVHILKNTDLNIPVLEFEQVKPFVFGLEQRNRSKWSLTQRASRFVRGREPLVQASRMKLMLAGLAS